MIKITDKDLLTIEDFAKQAFRRRPSFKDLSTGEMRIHCILVGIEHFLTSKGLNPGFEVEGWVQEDTEPVDDSGLDVIAEEPNLPKYP